MYTHPLAANHVSCSERGPKAWKHLKIDSNRNNKKLHSRQCAGIRSAVSASSWSVDDDSVGDLARTQSERLFSRFCQSLNPVNHLWREPRPKTPVPSKTKSSSSNHQRRLAGCCWFSRALPGDLMGSAKLACGGALSSELHATPSPPPGILVAVTASKTPSAEPSYRSQSETRRGVK